MTQQKFSRVVSVARAKEPPAWGLAGRTVILNGWEPLFTFPCPFWTLVFYFLLLVLHVQIPLEKVPSLFPAPDPSPRLATVNWLQRSTLNPEGQLRTATTRRQQGAPSEGGMASWVLPANHRASDSKEQDLGVQHSHALGT